ncbi:hypothetical protein TrST_g13960 [Triparma strigata]|uniref:PA14 domain-containing protein n=1 Tax=Triparma strigata TaxID=1606541 RepID=A0A9W7EQY9_9STRA|nr:hypothetical protein TrST_g13960 [Triparma strigata]
MAGPPFYFTVDFGSDQTFNTWRLAGSGSCNYGFTTATLQIEVGGSWTNIAGSEVSGAEADLINGWSISSAFASKTARKVRGYISGKATCSSNTSSRYQLYVKGFNIGSTNAPAPSPIPSPTPPSPSGPLAVTLSGSNLGTCAVSGSCFSTGGSSASSNYANNERCTFTVSGPGTLEVEWFETESGYDKLIIGSTQYSGSSRPSGIVVTSNQELTWSSDGSEIEPGFKICVEPPEVASCNAGQYASGSSCLDCPVGKFSSAGSEQCTVCASGKYSASQASSSCYSCPAGKYLSDAAMSSSEHDSPNDCSVCGGGKYSSVGSNACTNCAAGKYNSGDSTSASLHDSSVDCASCVRGKASSPGSSSCTICDAGKYSSIEAASSCTSCPRGKSLSDAGSTVSAHDSSSDCIICSSGKYSSSSGSSSCISCSDGKYISDDSTSTASHDSSADCSSCAEGKSSSSGASSCSICAAGKYSSSEGSSSCASCPAGKFLSDSGLTTSAHDSSSDCTICAAGKYAEGIGSSSCVNCDSGKYNSDNSATASRHDSSADCIDCSAGRFSEAGSSSCSTCSGGQYLASSSNCADCAAGKYSLGSVCDECPGGKFSGAGSSECVGCDAGKYLVTAATSSKSTACAECSSGKYSGMSAASCTACSAGKKLIDSLEDSEEDACEQCESGKYATSSSSSCTSCSPGKYSGVGASSCNTCAAGKYGVRADTSSASVACQECETGKFSGESSDDCSTCAPGKHLVKSDTATASIACESCVAGTKSSETRAECQICEQGTYSGPNSNSCENCPSGKAGSDSSTDASLHAGSSSCISCAKGKFAETEASVLCEVCPSGRFTSTITTTICTGCAVGKYLSDDRTDAALHDSQNDCISCTAGKFSKEGASTCTACGDEKSSPTASGVCSKCPKGKFDKLTDWSIHIEASSSEGVINLAEIEAMDADGVKITPLRATMLEAKSANPASNCVDSITTNYCLSDDATRNNWLRIDYNAEDLPKLSRIVINNREDCCKDRIVGSRIYVVGDQLRSNLGAYAYAIWSGTFDTAEATFDFYPTFDISSAVPSADCEDCSSQTYQDDQGQTSCKGCSPGKSSTNFDRGVRSEEDLSCVACFCMAGNICDPTETNEDNTPKCLPCEAGKYASSLGGSTCLPCRPGRYSGQASAYCSNCQSGEAPNDSKTACDKCDFGKVSISGDADCHSCDRSRGEISGEAGKSCERCNPGKFAKEDNSCETCEAGKFSDGLKSACVACGAGEVSLEGQSSCTPCNPGEVPNGDSSACRTCSAGEYSQFEFVDCESCNKPGEYSHEGAAFCDIVDPGEWPTLENDNDRFCYKDHFSLGGNDTCTKCTEGSHSEKGSTFCRSCPPGRFFVDSKDEVIVEANDGTRSSLTELFEMDNASTVTSAYSYFLAPESGQFYFEFKAGAKAELFIGKNETAKEGIVDIEIATSEYRRSDAIDLDEGEFYFLQLQLASDSPDTSLFHFSVGAILPNSEMLTPIRVYQYLSGRQHCEKCEIGKHSLTGREPGSCTSCDSAKGFIAPRKGMSNCEYCGVGKYASENVCKVCSAGTYSLGGSSCKFCLPNEYSGEDGASFCSHCPGGKIVNEANTGCDNCTAGQRSSPGDMKCSNCNPGYYSSTEGASSCTFCEGGKYSEVEGNSNCTVCEAGRYSNNRRTGCSPCPGGTFSQEGASSCTVCSAGYFCPEEATETRSCPAGKYSGSGSSSCSDCQFGYVASNETSSSCTFCGAGTYADSTTNVCIDCEPSKYSIGGTQSCSPCTMNTYSSKARSASCSFCQAGKIVSLNGAGCVACSKGSVSSLGDFECRTCKKGEYSGEGSTCNLCDAGKISDDASAICTECEAGKYSNDNRTACIGCNPGSYAPKGHSSCTACGGGTYCEAQSGAPILCPKATFSRSGSSVCSPCNTTLEYADEQGLSSCKVCSLNQIANKNHTGCVCKNGFQPVFDKNNTLSDCVCAAGYFNDQGACKRCAAGQYKENAGNVECTSCNQQAVRGSFLTQSSILEASVLEASGELNWDEIPPAISPRNCSCSIGDFYLEEPPPDDPEFEGFGYCAPCPKGAKCSKPGMDVASLALEKGFWRSSKKSHNLVQCFAPEACPQQKQVTDGEDVEEIGNITSDKSGQCREGHKGVVCNVCKNGYSKDVFGMCNACEHTRVPIQTALFFILSSIAMVLLMWHFFVRRRRRDAVRRLRPNSKPRLFRQARTKFKILMSFYQIVGGYENVLQVRFPPAFENFSRLVSSFINLNWLVLVNFDCVMKTTFYSKLLIYTLFPIIIAGLIFLYMKGKVTMMKIQKKGSSAINSVKDTCVELFLGLTFLVFASVSTTIFDTFNCQRFGDDPTYYLVQDQTIDCEDKTHSKYVGYSGFMLLIFPIGIPLLYTILLVGARKKLRDPDRIHDERLHRISFLWEMYTVDVWWFELFECARRLMMTGMLIFIKPGSPSQIVVAMIIALFSIVIYVHFEPYEEANEDQLAIVSQLAIFFTLFAALMIRVKADDEWDEAVFGALLVAVNSIGIIMVVTALISKPVLFVYHFFTGSKGRQWHNGSIKGLKEEHDDKTAFIEYFETLALSSQEESGFCYVEFKDAFWYTWLAESKAKLEWRCDEGDGGPLNQGRAIFEIPLSVDEIQNYLLNKECQPRRRVRELRVEADQSREAGRRVLYSVRRSKWPLNDRDCLVEQFTSDSSHEEAEFQILMETIYKRAVAQDPKANLNADRKADRKVNRKEDQRPRPRFSVLQTSKLSGKKRALGPKFLKGAKCIVERSIMGEEIQSTKESNKLGYFRADININGFLLIPMEVQSSKDENVEVGPLTKVIYITSGDQTSNDVALSFGRRALKNGMKNMVDDLIDVWYLKMHPEAAAAATAPLRKARSKRKKFLNRFTSYGNDERDWSFGGKVKGWAKKFSSGMSRIPKDPMLDDSYNITKSNGVLANLDELGDVEMNSLEAGSRNPITKAGLEVNEDGLLQLEQASIADSRPPAEDEIPIMRGTSVAVLVLLL